MQVLLIVTVVTLMPRTSQVDSVLTPSSGFSSKSGSGVASGSDVYAVVFDAGSTGKAYCTLPDSSTWENVWSH